MRLLVIMRFGGLWAHLGHDHEPRGGRGVLAAAAGLDLYSLVVERANCPSCWKMQISRSWLRPSRVI
jgi:hypothetical protein